MLTFVAHLPSVIFTRRGSKGRRKPPKVPSLEGPGELADESALRRWSERYYKGVMDNAKIEHVEIPKLEKELEKHKAKYDRADKRLKALRTKLRDLNNQLRSSVKAKGLLEEEIARSRWGSTSNLEALYERLRRLNRQIEFLSKRVGWIREQRPRWERIRDEAAKKMAAVSDAISTRRTLLDLPDPFLGPVKDFLFGPEEDPVEEPIEDPFMDDLIK